MKKNQKLTLANVEKLHRNQELKKLVVECLAKKAELQVIGPEVEAVYNKILKKYNFVESKVGHLKGGAKITDYKLLYRSVQNACKYFKEVNAALSVMGFKKGIPETHCPKAVLESDIIQIESKIIDIVSDAFGLGEIYRLEQRRELVDITISLLVNEKKEGE